MSSNAFPEDSLQGLIKTRDRGGKLPKLVWALDNEPGAHTYTKRWAKQARALGFVCEAAQIPLRDGRKTDWNDLHQRWSFNQDESERADQIAADLKQARHLGALLLADSAAEKALLMYDWNKRGEFHLGFGSRLYWFKLDMEKFNRAMPTSRTARTTTTSCSIRRNSARKRCNSLAVSSRSPTAIRKLCTFSVTKSRTSPGTTCASTSRTTPKA
jgi:hypothetical protein